jgi:hypothetical protein
VKASGLPVPQQQGVSSGGGLGQRSRKVVQDVAATVDIQFIHLRDQVADV